MGGKRSKQLSATFRMKKKVDGQSDSGYQLGVIMNLDLQLSLNALLTSRAAVEV
jgi:hypothetical protein